ncbi:MAG TPA: SigE family RNA polymerase sigma factor [Jatrophihabitantaceae bacterium]|nr:SigE family RNA polymerase sigma factor [Jatrophihabitantaceae bacterium]
MTEAERQAEFTSFVQTHWTQLMTIAVAVSGSRHEAEDLVQTALTNTYGRWPKIREGEALAYLRRSITNAHISRWRRHRGGELILAEPPDAGAVDRAASAVDDRRTLVPLLRELPHRQRSVLVLRYLCDLTDDDVAATLGTSTGTVRSQAARGLATLRRRHTRSGAQPDDESTQELVLSHPEGNPR